jgi:hypothetical protein
MGSPLSPSLAYLRDIPCSLDCSLLECVAEDLEVVEDEAPPPPLDAVLSPELWTALGQPFEAWVCALAPCLAVGLACDPAMAAMAQLGEIALLLPSEAQAPPKGGL